MYFFFVGLSMFLYPAAILFSVVIGHIFILLYVYVCVFLFKF